jgi:IS1 family transposase
VANVLPFEKRLRVLAALVDGNSVRATSRMTEVHQDTISRFALSMGTGAQHLHDRLVRDLSCTLIEVDEQWSYVQKKQARVDPVKDSPDHGDAWTWVAIDRNSRLAVAFYVGKRGEESAQAFTDDLRARLVTMPQITSDGLSAYVGAIGSSFGPGVDYGQTVKNYRHGSHRGPDHRYEPARDPFVTKRVAHVERNNLTMRHVNGRLRRLCLAFSKKLDNHRAAAALGFAWYNFGHVVKTLRVTPAMAAGVTDHVWTIEEFMETVLAEVDAGKPERQPLAHRAPVTTARELPNGRGFLRVVGASSGPSAPPVAPVPPPVAPRAVAAVAPIAVADANGQLDLLSWVAPVPKPRRYVQMDLFGIEIEPGKP